MTTTRDIRTELAALMDDSGYRHTAYTYEAIGMDAGSKLHRSYATTIERRDYQAREGRGSCRLVLLTVGVRVLLQRQRDSESESAYDVDDATDALVDLLESFGGDGYSTRVDSAESSPHDRLSAMQVITVSMTVTMREYRSGDYA